MSKTPDVSELVSGLVFLLQNQNLDSTSLYAVKPVYWHWVVVKESAACSAGL